VPAITAETDAAVTGDLRAAVTTYFSDEPATTFAVRRHLG
jgi:hypothetical protein